MKSETPWQFSLDHRQPCKLIETEEVWGRRFARIWLPHQNEVVRVHEDRLRPLDRETPQASKDHLTYVAAAAKVADCLNQNILLAPISSTVIPLPHQIRALTKAVSGERVRYLLADEVGLGKTIEAGLVMRELKLRGLVRRILVVAPKGLCTQWVSEMETHFGETFQLVLPDDLKTLRRLCLGRNALRDPFANGWRAFDQVVCPLDSVKPVEKRRGWSLVELAEYNRERFEDLVSAGWDMVVVDEAHRLGGAHDQVARYKLGKGLSEAAPYLLLLSATPHQGNTDAFRRLLSLLDAGLFPDEQRVNRSNVSPFVIRTEKRHAITADGKLLFQSRQTRLVAVAWEERHSGQKSLYDAVTEYVRVGYNQALREKKSYIGFLMILMQRLVTSSTRAILTSLERRLQVLKSPDEQLSFFSAFNEDEWGEMDGQEQLEALLKTRFTAMKNEQAEVSLLLHAARNVESQGSDAKAGALLEWIYRLQQEESDPELKILVFTEFVPTQEMLADFFRERGFSVSMLNGTMGMEERKNVQEAFRSSSQILISTDAGGEGLNLQFCHLVANYDIPWNPMRLEQRIGRVDRIGQRHHVRALNFVLNDTVEFRVRQVLEEKLAIILKEFGVDKTSDVLDSAEAEAIFDHLYIDALLNPEQLGVRISEVAGKLSLQTEKTVDARGVLGGDEPLDSKIIDDVRSRRIEYWVEKMISSYLSANGGSFEKDRAGWRCGWPDGQKEVFALAGSADTDNRPLSLEHPRVLQLCKRLPRFVETLGIPFVAMTDLPDSVVGWWSLWQIIVHSHEWQRQRIFCLFLTDTDHVLAPTANRVWDRLIDGQFNTVPQPMSEATYEIANRLRQIALREGRPSYNELIAAHRRHRDGDRARMEASFAARRNIISKIGLPAVRAHRLAALQTEEKAWQDRVLESSEPIPEFNLLALIRIQGGNHG